MYSYASICKAVGIEGMNCKFRVVVQYLLLASVGEIIWNWHKTLKLPIFFTYFTRSPAAESTPHLYISALATWPWRSSLSQNWKNQFTHIPVFTHNEDSIDLPLTTVSAKASIKNVTFSSDGMQIVFSLDDGSVQVWDAFTGVELKKLKGPVGVVSLAVFLSDSMRIVSGLVDNSVLVWDASTGVELKKLKGHTGYVFLVAFSSDDIRIVSGSFDNSVRVWNVSTQLHFLLMAHR